jgi:hypothetical protein
MPTANQQQAWAQLQVCGSALLVLQQKKVLDSRAHATELYWTSTGRAGV